MGRHRHRPRSQLLACFLLGARMCGPMMPRRAWSSCSVALTFAVSVSSSVLDIHSHKRIDTELAFRRRYRSPTYRALSASLGSLFFSPGVIRTIPSIHRPEWRLNRLRCVFVSGAAFPQSSLVTSKTRRDSPRVILRFRGYMSVLQRR